LGKLVRLTTKMRAEAPARTGAEAPEGKLVLFTGVRYERTPDVTPDAPKAGASGGGKRRRG
jgi:hypothetical protein